MSARTFLTHVECDREEEIADLGCFKRVEKSHWFEFDGKGLLKLLMALIGFG